MTSPDPNQEQEQEQEQDSSALEVPPANPAYSTPPPEGLPDADDA
jgi:hypothetical protein